MRDFDRSFNWMRTLILIMFSLTFVGVLVVWGVTAYLGFQCYTSNDPNSMACYMMSDRVEVGVRNR